MSGAATTCTCGWKSEGSVRFHMTRYESIFKEDLERLEHNVVQAIASQTRAMFFAIVTIVLTMSGLVLAVAK